MAGQTPQASLEFQPPQNFLFPVKVPNILRAIQKSKILKLNLKEKWQAKIETEL